MALIGDRQELQYDIEAFMAEVAERGGVVAQKTAGSGGYPGDPNTVVTYAANPSGQNPVGVLLMDMVSIDLSRFHINFYRNQVPLNYKVPLLTVGEVTTNMIIGTPVGGEPAYLSYSGNISPTQLTGAPKVGSFRTKLDEDGYAKVRITL